MNQPQLPLIIEQLKLPDIPAVVALEQAAYATSLSLRDYYYELQYNALAHYFGLKTLPSTPISEAQSVKNSSPLMGIGGFWLMADELHIITLAIRPNRQRLGLGEWLLLNLLEEGGRLGAESATLEVRPSNRTAISLYQKYQFQQAGRRPNYYQDTGEDGLIFTIPELNAPDYQTRLAQQKAGLIQRLAQIKF